MPVPIIPMRPKRGFYDLKPEEMDCLNWHILSGCPRDEAFLRFIRPDYLGNRSAPAVKEAVKQFFAAEPVRRYMEEYKATITEREKEKEEEKPAASLEERKARAKTKAMEFAMDLANHIEDAEDPETVLKLMDKVGLLDTGEEVVEQPRRYLPVQCLRECRYRLFCEENTTDECQFCRYKQYGEENGVHYDPENQLDVPGAEVDNTSEN